jgi:predicted metal-dependent peptidase
MTQAPHALKELHEAFDNAPRKAQITRIPLDPRHERAWTETRAAFLWSCPAFSHIFYTLMAEGDDLAYFTTDVPIAATDGTRLLLNPETFFKYTLNERVFAIAHEVTHCIFAHNNLMWSFHQRGKVTYSDGAELPYIHPLMNVAMDLVINDLLIQDKVGVFSKNWLHDTSIANCHDSVIDAYRKVFQKVKQAAEQKGKGNPDKPCNGGQGPGQPGDDEGDGEGNPGGYGVPGFEGQSFDEHLAPGSAKGKDANEAAQGRNEVEWKTQIAAAAAAAKARGKLPGNLARLFNEILDPGIDWRDKIETFFARKLGSGGYDWRRCDRRSVARPRDPYFSPARSGHGCGTIVWGIDTSGSIGQAELDMFFGCMSSLLEEMRPKRMVLIWCDAAVRRVDEVEEAGDLADVRRKGVPGGGGTRFEPVFDEIEKLGLEPDCLIYLTDGLGSFGAPPSYPVLWASIYSKEDYYPWGDVVMVPRPDR